MSEVPNVARAANGRSAGRARAKAARAAGNPYGTLTAISMRGPNDPTEFDLQVRAVKLTGGSIGLLTGSPQLREWVKLWYRQRYVPEELLDAWGLRLPD